tara:strand:+ start:438 stop:581 length:144 start_codon:yes stop_codon:yes gene_type:complete
MTTEAQWMKNEKQRLIKQFGPKEGNRRWNQMMEKGIVKNKGMKIRPT